MNKLREMLILAACWSPSFLFIKLATTEMHPAWLVSSRMVIGSILCGILLLILSKFYKISLSIKHLVIKDLLFMGLFACTVPYMLFAHGGLYINSALLGIINGSTPIFTLLIAHVITNDEKISKRKVISLISGLIGFCVIVGPTLIDGSIDADTWAIVGVFIAALSYAVSMVYSKVKFKGPKSLMTPFLTLCFGAVFSTLFAYYTAPLPNFSHYSSTTLLAALGLGVFGTCLSTMMYFRISRLYGATILSYTTFLLPIFATLLGVTILGETVASSSIIGAGFILFGLFSTIK